MAVTTGLSTVPHPSTVSGQPLDTTTTGSLPAASPENPRSVVSVPNLVAPPLPNGNVAQQTEAQQLTTIMRELLGSGDVASIQYRRDAEERMQERMQYATLRSTSPETHPRGASYTLMMPLLPSKDRPDVRRYGMYEFNAAGQLIDAHLQSDSSIKITDSVERGLGAAFLLGHYRELQELRRSRP
jgi:hypothetical protein